MVGMSEGKGSMPSRVGGDLLRVNMIAALCQQKLIAPFTVEGACKRVVFETWLETCKRADTETRTSADSGQCYVSQGWVHCITATSQAGCHLLYLPPYSPDLNNIERCWSWLKSRIRKHLNQFDCLRDAIESILRLAS